jgi:DNA-binding MarR family transcriptional regulator
MSTRGFEERTAVVASTRREQTQNGSRRSTKPDELADANPTWVGLRLLAITNRFMTPIHADVEGRFGLTRDDVAVIVCLSISEATTAQQVVRYTARPKNSISRAVAALEVRGLIRRSAHPTDGRASALSLTAGGRRCYRQLGACFSQGDSQMIESLTEQEQHELLRLIGKIAAGVAGESSVMVRGTG